jgi:hypothetical protein
MFALVLKYFASCPENMFPLVPKIFATGTKILPLVLVIFAIETKKNCRFILCLVGLVLCFIALWDSAYAHHPRHAQGV